MPSIREGLNKGHLSKYTYKEKGKDTRDFEKNVLMYIYRLKYPDFEGLKYSGGLLYIEA